MNVFKKLRIPNQLPEEQIYINPLMMKIYNKPFTSATQKEKDYFYLTLKQLSFFQKLLLENQYGEVMFRTIMKRMRIKILKPGTQIYRVKEPIADMFFVLEGKVIVYKPPKQYNIKKAKEGKRINYIEKLVCAFKNSISAQANKEFDRFVEKGEQYGMEDIKKSKREVLTETHTICVVGFLSIADYILIFEKTEFLQKNDVLSFMAKMDMFKTVSFDLGKIYHIIKIKIYRKGDILCSKGDKFKSLYIIKSGSFQISFKNSVKMCNDFDLSSFENKEINYRYPSCISKLEVNDFYKDIYDYKILNCGRREIIGNIEYVYQKKKYLFDIKCEVDNSFVLEIPIEKFDTFAGFKLKCCLIESGKKQKEYFDKRIGEIRTVNKHREDKQNKYKSLIVQKINITKGKIIEEIEKKEAEEKSVNLKHIKFKKFPKKIFFIEDPLKGNSEDNLPDDQTNYSIIHNNNTTENSYNEIKGRNRNPSSFYCIKKNKFSHSNYKTQPSSIKLVYKSPHMRNEFFNLVNEFSTNYTEANNTNIYNSIEGKEKYKNKDKDKDKGKRSVVYENNKKNYSNCFEINKNFFLKNNTSILDKKLNTIFMDLGNKKE